MSLTCNAVDTRDEPAGVPQPSAARKDIQGLRAFAVIAVVIDHLTGWPGGGFVGVDVFFVISGFLITGLLLRQHQEHGRISILNFYQRRFKRIMPAALLVIATTLVAASLAFSSNRFDQAKSDAWAAALFYANWNFEGQRVDYFNANRQVSPLQHYWSLSIEEQFYFVWPWLMILIFAVLLRLGATRRSARGVIGVVMAVAVGASFTWALTQTQVDAHSAYFSSFTRVWELGLGALLAVAAPLVAKLPVISRPFLAWLGLAGMVASLWVVEGDRGFPAPWAALPVLSTALVIAAGTFADGRQQRFLWPLTNRGSNYIGDVSYSLYLWHFPVIVICGELLGESVGDKLLLAFAMAALSCYAYELFENPLRHATWFGRRASWRRDVRLSTDRSEGHLRRVGFSALVLSVGTLVFVALQPVEPPRSALDNQVFVEPSEAETAATYGPEVTKLQGQIQEALSDSTWPDDLDPSMDEAIGSLVAPIEIIACSEIPNGPSGPSECAWGPESADKTAVLVGDSVAMSFAEGLRDATVDEGWRFLMRAARACPFVDQEVNVGEDTYNPDCPDFRAAALRDIRDVQPDVLFVVNHIWQEPDYESEESWLSNSQALLQQIQGDYGQLVYISGPPTTEDPQVCFKPGNSPADCTGRLSAPWREMFNTQTKLAEENDGILVDSSPWFCFLGLCPPYVGTTPTRPDAPHVLPAYMEKIQPAISETLDDAGVYGSRQGRAGAR